MSICSSSNPVAAGVLLIGLCFAGVFVKVDPVSLLELVVDSTNPGPVVAELAPVLLCNVGVGVGWLQWDEGMFFSMLAVW